MHGRAQLPEVGGDNIFVFIRPMFVYVWVWLALLKRSLNDARVATLQQAFRHRRVWTLSVISSVYLISFGWSEGMAFALARLSVNRSAAVSFESYDSGR